MATVVSTGQITIVDNNDAKPITAFVSANAALQQVFTKDDTSVAYIPNYYTTALVLTPKIYVGGVTSASDLSSSTTQIINRRWTTTIGAGNIYNGTATTQDTTNFVQTDGSTVVTSPFTVSANGLTLTIAGNLKEATKTYSIFFEADYKDPATGLVTHLIADVQLGVLKTGTNAVYVQVRGKNVIETASGSTKNSVALCADLIRSTGVDRSSLDYKWYDITSGTAVQISTSITNYNMLYAFSDTAATSVPTTASLDTSPTPVNNNTLPTLGSAKSYNSSGVGSGNTLTLSENAVTDIAIFRVDITDTAETKTYSGYFTVYDISDPYAVIISSTTGDKLPNGTGSTTLSPTVYYGDTKLASLSGWTFDWVFYDRDGKRAAFVDKDGNTAATSMYNSGAGRTITANTASTITFDAISTALSLATNDIVKVVKDGVAKYYEITGTPTTTSVTLKTAGLTNLSLTDYPLPAANDFTTGTTAVIYACTLAGKRSGSSIVVTGEDIDTKGMITCAANRP